MIALDFRQYSLAVWSTYAIMVCIYRPLICPAFEERSALGLQTALPVVGMLCSEHRVLKASTSPFWTCMQAFMWFSFAVSTTWASDGFGTILAEFAKSRRKEDGKPEDNLSIPYKVRDLATRHFCKQASGGILRCPPSRSRGLSKEPLRAPFDKLRVLATAKNTATFRNCQVARYEMSGSVVTHA